MIKKPDKIHYSYKINDKTCKDCKNVFIFEEFDSENSYFCVAVDKSKRPSCGSVFMGEYNPNVDQLKEYNNFLLWSKDREVDINGCCDLFKPKNKITDKKVN